MTTAHVLVEARNALGESPRWDHTTGRLSWVDIDRGELWSCGADGGSTASERRTAPLGSIELAGDGRYVTLVGDEVRRGPADAETVLATLGLRGVRFNDSGVDPAGRLWSATMPLDEGASDPCMLYCLRDGVLDPAGIAVEAGNGIGWSPAGSHMYVVDSGTRVVHVADFDEATGTVTSSRPFVSSDAAVPDGLAVDADGGVWIAWWGGGRVDRFDERGALTHTIEVGTPFVTACEFGGPRRDRLYITSARRTDHPLGGSLFIAEVGATGLARNRMVA